MIKQIQILFFLFLFLNLFLSSGPQTEKPQVFQINEENPSLITEIFLVKSQTYNGTTTPSKLVIWIKTRQEAYMKLHYKKEIIKGGLLTRGFNIVHIPASGLFERSETYLYNLELKTENLIEKKEIKIDIQVDISDPVKKKEETVKTVIYDLSMFIGDRLILASKKTRSKKIALKMELPKFEANPDLWKLPSKDNMAQNTVPILGLALAAVQLITETVFKKEKPKLEETIPTAQEVTAIFSRLSSYGIPQKVKAIIKLSWGDEESEGKNRNETK